MKCFIHEKEGKVIEEHFGQNKFVKEWEGMWEQKRDWEGVKGDTGLIRVEGNAGVVDMWNFGLRV